MPDPRDLQNTYGAPDTSGSSATQLKDFEGGTITVATPDGSTVTGVLQWDRSLAKDAPLSGWRIVTNSGRVPIQANSQILTNSGRALTIGAQGTIIDKNTPAAGQTYYSPNVPPGYVPIYDAQGNVVDVVTDKSPGGSGGGGGGGISGSYYIPNAIDILNAQLKVYEDMAAQGQIPHKDAVDAFNAFAQQVQNTIQAQSQQGQFQQNAAIYGNQAQNDYNTLQQRIAEAKTSRAQNIQSELTNRQNTLANSILPFSVEGNYSLNLPLIGDVPMTHINPNQFFDIAGLNNIPQPVTTPTAPQAIPVPTVTAPAASEYPAIPNTQLPNFDLSALLRAAGIAA